VSVPPLFPDVADQLALLLRATLLMGAAWAAAAALRKAGTSAASRHMAWLLAIAALLALPVLWWLVPALRLPVLPAEAAAAAPSHAFASEGPIAPDVLIPAGWAMVWLAVYALGAAALLLRLIAGRQMLKRLWSEAGAVRDPAWEALLSGLASGMGLSRPVELRISRGPAVPMTWGTLSPKLLLPAEACEWPLERRRLVLLHELAHVARRDSLSRSAASLACALYWFHPGVWFAARQMRMEQEQAADDRVLMAGGSPQAYALSLLHLARGAGARPRFDQAAAMAGMYQLERRLVSITSPARRDRPGIFFLSSSALLAGCTTLLVAAGAPVSATSTLRGPYEAGPAEPASPRAGNSAPGARRAERVSRHPAASASRSGPAPKSSSAGPDPQANELADPGPRRGDEIVASRSEPPSSRSAPHAQPLSDYGWELQRRDSRLEMESSTASSRPARLILPVSPSSESSARAGRPKWARNVPRLVQGGTPTRSPIATSEGPLMLSWSIEVGGK
jgi:beta-lactamase regulating signal transducer with metallopeptidase domain